MDNCLGAWSVEHIAAWAGIFPKATTIDLRGNDLESWSVEQIAAWAGVFPKATTIDLSDSNLEAWSVEHIEALVGVFPEAETIALDLENNTDLSESVYDFYQKNENIIVKITGLAPTAQEEVNAIVDSRRGNIRAGYATVHKQLFPQKTTHGETTPSPACNMISSFLFLNVPGYVIPTETAPLEDHQNKPLKR